MDGLPVDRRERFRDYLEELTRAEGILRPDLLELLQGKLDELRAVWSIKPDNDIDAARKIIIARLKSHIQQLEPRRANQNLSIEQRGRQYRLVVFVNFNILDRPELREKKLMDRRNWLASGSAGQLSIKVSTGIEDLNHAIAQIADLLADGETNLAEQSAPESRLNTSTADRETADQEQLTSELDGSRQDGRSDLAETTALPASKFARLISRRKVIVLLAIATVAVVAVTTFVVYDPFRTSAGPSDTSGGSGPVPVPASSPLVAVENVTGMNSLDGDLRFVTPTPTTMSPAQLTSFNSDVILKSANFSPWYAGHGAVPVDVGVATVTFRDSTSETVRITNIEAVKDCKAPYTGTIFTGYKQGGPSGTVKIGMNLDDPQPVARELAVTSEGLTPFGPGYFLTNTLDVAPGDLTTITLGAFTKHYGCSFKLRLTIVTSHGSYYQDIDDAGRPFLVTAEAPAAKAGYPDSGYQTAYAQGPSTQWSAVDPQTYQGP